MFAGRQCHDLRLAGTLQIIEPNETFSDIFAHSQGAVVAKDHGILCAEVRDQAITLVKVHRDAFIVVECDVTANQHCSLG